MPKLNKKLIYIVIEGIVGTGKSTQSKKIQEYLRKKYPNKEIILTREPGGTEIAENIRKAVQGTKYEEEMDPICEAYLYAGARAQSLRKIVKQINNKDTIVISDRSFITSTANQGEGRSIGIDKVLKINEIAIEGFLPDIVFFLDLPYKMGLKRVFDHSGDKFESLGEDFYSKVEEGYKKIQMKKGLFSHWINIDATGNENEVFKKIVYQLDLFV